MSSCKTLPDREYQNGRNATLRRISSQQIENIEVITRDTLMTRPWILGIASSHNGSACLLHGKTLVVAVQEERLLRYKRAEHPGAFPSLAVQYCLDAAGIKATDLQSVALASSETALRPEEDIRANPQLDGGRAGLEVFYVPHHLGHAVAAYAMGAQQNATVLVVDGAGSLWQDLPREERRAVPLPQLARAFGPDATCHIDEAHIYDPAKWQPREVASIYTAEQGKFTAVEKHISLDSSLSPSIGMAPFASLGNMYAAVGLQIFGNFLDGPGKVMGLAPYGRPTIPIEEFYRVVDWGFDFQTGAIRRFQHNDRWPNRRAEYQDLAASVQKAVEEGLLVLCERLRQRCSIASVCYAGGVALNSVANERIVREAGFHELFIMPAAEDSGTSIGAAYYALWQTHGYAPISAQRVDSLGKNYSQQDVSHAIRSSPGVSHSTPPNIVDEVCELLADGKIVGWFQDGSELGPRSLGQRSIFCDPRGATTKDILNERVKFREPFRPFAPVILEEDVEDWFEVDPARTASPFMLRVMRFRPERAAEVPAVVHVDRTGRVQTVSREFSPRLHALLTAWKRRSGVPILLNTSFNVAGEPIVETPEDAIWCLTFTGIDCCVLGDQLVNKALTGDGLLDWVITPTYKTFALHDKANRPNKRIEVPDLAGASENAVSAHVSRADHMAARLQAEHLRVVVLKPWGDVAHGISPALVRILELVNGHRTAREIFDIVTASGSTARPSAYTVGQFRRHLGTLRRAGAIGFSESRVGETHPATSAVVGAAQPTGATLKISEVV
jgi:carbamoyltransferase